MENDRGFLLFTVQEQTWQTRNTFCHSLVSLTNRRLRWRHDQVLAQLADGLENERKRNRTNNKAPLFSGFFRPGEKTGKQDRGEGILAMANDWKMKVDLGR